MLRVLVDDEVIHYNRYVFIIYHHHHHHQANKAGEDEVGATVFSKLSIEGAGHEEPEDGGRAATGILVSEPRARDIR